MPERAAEGGAERYLVVATVRRPHGVKGELSLALETDRPRSVFRKGRRLLLGDAAGRPTGGALTVERTRGAPGGGLLLTAQEFSTRNAELEALRGRSLLINASEAAPADEGELHYLDLIGMTVRADGRAIGQVRSITETLAGEILVLVRPGGGELLVPFVRDWIRAVDETARTLDVEPPEGLLEL